MSKTHGTMTELSEIAEPGWYIDEDGWSQKLPITDQECMLICLENAPLGTDRKQVMRLIQSLKQSGYESSKCHTSHVNEDNFRTRSDCNEQVAKRRS